MNIVLFSMTVRYALIVATIVLAAATLLAVRAGRPRVGAALGVGALGALGALCGEALVALTVKLAAPAATDFNEYRWVFLSPWGRLGLYLGGAWARDDFGNYDFPCEPGGEKQRELAFRMGVNFVMYALCLDYKSDQVHVPFIMKRRRWKPDDGASTP